MTQYLLVGQSHINAIRKAVSADEANWFNVVNINQDPIHWTGLDELEIKRRQFADVDVLCLSIGGNFHNVLGMLNHPQPFWMVTGPENGQFVPVDMLRRKAEIAQSEAALIALSICNLMPSAKRIVISPPPPMANTDHIAKYPGVFADKIHLGFSPAAHRREIYRIQIALAARTAVEIGAIYLDTPAEAADGNGFLRDEFCNADPTHGNARYGRLVLDQILSGIGATT